MTRTVEPLAGHWPGSQSCVRPDCSRRTWPGWRRTRAERKTRANSKSHRSVSPLSLARKTFAANT